MSDSIKTNISLSGKFIKGSRRRAKFTIQKPVTQQIQPSPDVVKKKYFFQNLPITFIFLFFLFVTLVISGYRVYLSSKKTVTTAKQTASPVLRDLDTNEIIKRVRTHMVLPEEDVVVQTVTDAEKVRQEPFYAKATNGDKVLVFAKRAILYNPTQDKIIEVGTILQPTVTPVVKAPEGAQNVAGAATSSARILFQNDKK